MHSKQQYMFGSHPHQTKHQCFNSVFNPFKRPSVRLMMSETSVNLTLVIIQMVVLQFWLSQRCFSFVNQTLSMIQTCVFHMRFSRWSLTFPIQLLWWLIKMFMILICLPWTPNFLKNSPSTRRKTQKKKLKGWRERLYGLCRLLIFLLISKDVLLGI